MATRGEDMRVSLQLLWSNSQQCHTRSKPTVIQQGTDKLGSLVITSAGLQRDSAEVKRSTSQTMFAQAAKLRQGMAIDSGYIMTRSSHI